MAGGGGCADCSFPSNKIIFVELLKAQTDQFNRLSGLQRCIDDIASPADTSLAQTSTMDSQEDMFGSMSMQSLQSHPGHQGSMLRRSRSIGASSVCSSSSSLPPSALRKGKFDTSANSANDDNRPLLDLSLIYSSYGEGASLYNVLCVTPDADAADIRKAYLRQGRKTLLEYGIAHQNDRGECSFSTSDTPQKLEDVPKVARRQFQAISIAYEILSTPELRSDYDEFGVVREQSSPQTDVSHPGHRRSRSGNSVRWRSYVEEKIIHDAHPDEHNHRKRRDEVSAVLGENEGWLESHLQRLDDEAQMFFNGDILDELDESIASMSESFQESLASLIRKGNSRHSESQQKKEVAVELTSERQQQQVQDYSGKKNILKSKALSMSIRAKSFVKVRGNSSHSGESPALRMQFSEDLEEQQSPDNSISEDVNEKISSFLDSPCSVLSVGQLGEFVEGLTSGLAESFYGILDGPESNKNIAATHKVEDIKKGRKR